MNKQNIRLTKNDALLVVDVQYDFLPGGSLGVKEGDQVVSVLNEYIARFHAEALPIYATRDWHPANHCSFKAQGGIWPPHCIAGTHGAAFPSNLNLPPTVQVISKATEQNKDAYSGFGSPELKKQLVAHGVTRVFIGGLTTDYCVLNTVKDAVEYGFQVVVLADAIRAVNVQPEDGERAIAAMKALGAVLATRADIGA